MSERFTAPQDDALYLQMCAEIEEKLRRAAPLYTRRYPHVSTLPAEGLRYTPEENNIWTSSFHPGMMCLAAKRTGDAAFLQYKDDYIASFKARLDDRVGISHDLGFLYTLSAVALYKLTGDEEARALALRAADMLCERYNEKGRYIQAWGEFNVGTPYVKIIVDTMLNLPLLFWAGETTGEARYTNIATAHAHTCADYLVREEYSACDT